MSIGKFAMERKTLGERLKEIREAKSLTLQEMAKALGISNGFLSEVERNKKMPGGNFFISLKREYKISLDVLLGDGKADGDKAAVIAPEESRLLTNFRSCDEPHRLQLMEMAQLYAGFCMKSQRKGTDEKSLKVSNSE